MLVKAFDAFQEGLRCVVGASSYHIKMQPLAKLLIMFGKCGDAKAKPSREPCRSLEDA